MHWHCVYPHSRTFVARFLVDFCDSIGFPGCYPDSRIMRQFDQAIPSQLRTVRTRTLGWPAVIFTSVPRFTTNNEYLPVLSEDVLQRGLY